MHPAQDGAAIEDSEKWMIDASQSLYRTTVILLAALTDRVGNVSVVFDLPRTSV
jgi:hypothetical protein